MRLFPEDFHTLSATEKITSALVGALLAAIAAIALAGLAFAAGVALLR